jgi:hypothetical protein
MKLRGGFWPLAGAVLLTTGGFFAGLTAQGKAPSTWPYPDSLDSIKAAPKNHKILYEDGEIRIVEVTIRPGETENLHGHKYSSIFIIPEPLPPGKTRT